MLPERKSCVGSHPCQSCRRKSCNGRGWVLLSTDSLKFGILEIDWANGESILGFIHAFVAVFSGWRGDRCQTKALDLTMKELEVKRSSAPPHNVLSPST